MNDGMVRAKKQMCATCIFRPGNRMSLQPGRVGQMVDDCEHTDGHIICHETLSGWADEEVPQAMCAGYLLTHSPQLFQVAGRLGRLEYVD